MKNFLQKIKYGMQKMMVGRYGMDNLNKALLKSYFICYLLNIVLKINILYYCSLFFFGFCIFRMFSKDIYKRNRENQVFLLKKNKLLHPLNKKRSQRNDKEHKYFTCPCCKQTLRVPAGHGKITITCPRCATKITKRT